MPPITYPNQRMVKINREPAKRDFLGILNENWQAAARDLRPYALLLYMYLASNADGFTLALSPAAVREAVGMARSTFVDQFQVLIDKGYIVYSHGNTFEFFETPQPRAVRSHDNTSSVNTSNELCTATDNAETSPANECPSANREINNSKNSEITIEKNNIENSVIEVPKVKEIVISRPKAEGRDRPKYNDKPKAGEFVF